MVAEMAKLAAFSPNAGATPRAATSAPPSGASAIWETTAADHRPLLAATSSCSSTMKGSTEAEAGLKNTRAGRQPERDRIGRRQVVINQRQHRGQDGALPVGGDHDPHPRQPVHRAAGDRREQQHRQDRSDDRAPGC